MHTSPHGRLMIEGFEGYSYSAYWDQWGKVWTVGYGETGGGIGPGSTRTRAQADSYLSWKLANQYEPAINALGVELNRNQFDGLASFVWNLGAGSMAWDVGRYVRARNFQRAATAMLGYSYAGGVFLRGLADRRLAEAHLLLTPVSAPAPVDPHLYDRYPGDLQFHRRHGKPFTLNERKTVEAYDSLIRHPKMNRAKIDATRAHIRLLRDRVQTIGKPQGWPDDSRHLGWRWQRLNERLSGLVKL